MSTPLKIERLNNGAPLLHKVESHPWESKVTFNPACVCVSEPEDLASIIPLLPFDQKTKASFSREPELCFLLYRAQGRKEKVHDYTRSSIGLAILTGDLRLLARHHEPVIRPDRDYDNLGVEDGRITRVGDRYVMVYCAYSFDGSKNRIRIALASTRDFVHWEKHGLLNGDFNRIGNKNAMLFPDRVSGKLLMLHRPMQGTDALSIHWAEADDLFGEWKSRGLLMRAVPNPPFVDTWIGGGAPPIRLIDGRYLIIYHIGNRKSDGAREYDLGVAIGDPERKGFIVKRHEPLLRPETPAETNADADLGVNNVVFICGAYFHEGDLYFPYAGADTVVLGGKIGKIEIERYTGS